ncbi:CHAT domain-containing protein [Sinorhizobium sp. Sb3]|uniref:CHAT domain-containing protein n=1 Tax=Sinorhizobium sp. Sb3 TaxID=1358417 RepID=UPI0009E9FEBF|nr:CHAT domain-containing protein [Sinorhizobium sp. Sb3]
MSRTVISFRAQPNMDQGQHPLITFSIDAPGENLPEVMDAFLDVADAPLADFYNYHSDPTNPLDVVRKAGAALYESLLTHNHASHALRRTIEAENGTPDRQIRLRIPGLAASTQNLPWELLHAPTSGFVDLVSRIPVLREIETKSRPRTPDGLLTDEGLRFLSIIAAEGISGLEEWRAVSSALKKYGRPFQLRIFVAETAIKEKIEAETAGDDRMTTSLVPGNKLDLLNEVRSFAPQICHFLCHGQSDSGGYLEIANQGVSFGGAPLIIMASDLEDVLPGSAWLVLLNACLGAHANPRSGTSTLAAKLVKEGVPVVVGMRDEIPADIIGRFSHAFLSEVMRTIAKIAAGGVEEDLELGPCLSRARATICENFPGAATLPPDEIGARVKEWALPVMSVSKAPFRVRPKAGVKIDVLTLATLQSEFDTLSRLKHDLQGALSESQTTKIDVRIREIQSQMATLVTS